MATEAAVALGVLTNTVSATLDLEKASFGQPDAAIVIGTHAKAGDNPSDHGEISIGFFDGTNQVSIGIQEEALVGSSDTARYHSDSYVYSLPTLSNSVGTLASASWATNGVRLTMVDTNFYGNQSMQALLLKGLTNAECGMTALPNGGTTVSLSFTPDVVILIGNSNTETPDNGEGQAIISFGVSNKDSGSTYHHNVISYTSHDGQTTSLIEAISRSDSSSTTQFSGSIYSAKADNFSSGFDLTVVSGTPASRYVGWLALKFANPDDFQMNWIDTATSTGDQTTTSFSMQADALFLASARTPALNTLYSNTDIGSLLFGFSDGTVTRCSGHAAENISTSMNTECYYDDTNVLRMKYHDGTDDCAAALSSFTSTGFVLNYSDAATSSSKVLAMIFGNSSVGGTTHEGAFTLGLSNAFSNATNAIFSPSVSFTTQNGVSDSSLADFLAQTSLGISLAQTQVSGVDLSAIISFGLQNNLVFVQDGSIEVSLQLALQLAKLSTVNAIFDVAATFAQQSSMEQGKTADFVDTTSFGISQSTIFANVGVIDTSISFGITESFNSDGEVSTGIIEAAIAMGLIEGYSTLDGPNTYSPTTNIGIVNNLTSISIANLFAATQFNNNIAFTTNGGGAIAAAITYAIEHDIVQSIGLEFNGSLDLDLINSLNSASQATFSASATISHQIGLQLIVEAIFNAGLDLSHISGINTISGGVSVTITLPCGRTLVVQAENRILSVKSENRTTTISGC